MAVTAKLPHQNGPGQLYFPLKSHFYVHPGHDDTKWYHHDPDGHKDGIFTEKYGGVQICFHEVVLL